MDPKLETGDLVFFKGKSVISKLIRWLTKGDYSHVAIVHDSNFLFETDGSYGRAVFNQLADRLEDQDYTVMRYEKLDKKMRRTIKKLCGKYHLAPYSYWDVIVNGLMTPFGNKARGKVATYMGNKHFMKCDEIVMRILYEGTNHSAFRKYESQTPNGLFKMVSCIVDFKEVV